MVVAERNLQHTDPARARPTDKDVFEAERPEDAGCATTMPLGATSAGASLTGCHTHSVPRLRSPKQSKQGS